MGLNITRTRLDFQSPNGLSPYTEIVTGGLAPYAALSSNSNVITVAQATSPNLCPNSDTFLNWTLTGCALGTGGPGGAADLEVTGTGSAQTFNSNSPTFGVTPGQTLIASCFLNSLCSFTYTGEQPRMIVYDITHNAEIGSGDVYFTSGKNQRIAGAAFTVPAGCTQVRLQPHVAGAGMTIPSGQVLKISQPMLALSTYDPNTYISQTSAWTINPKYRGSATITYTDSTP